MALRAAIPGPLRFAGLNHLFVHNMSSTYVANVVTFLAFGLPFLGVHVVDQGALNAFLTGVVGIGAQIWVFIGRYRAGGINAFGVRTN